MEAFTYINIESDSIGRRVWLKKTNEDYARL